MRNFSYPINITNRTPESSTPTPPSPWDQLGEICNFSPDGLSQTRTYRNAPPQDPFFYTSDRAPYAYLRLADLEEEETEDQDYYSADPLPLSVGPVKSIGKCELGGENTPLSQNCPVEDEAASHRPNITSRLKRNSLGHHKTLSFDASRLFTRRFSSLERPLSSSSVPLIDLRLQPSTEKTVQAIVSPVFSPGNTIECFSPESEISACISYTLSDSYAAEMESYGSRSSPKGLRDTKSGFSDQKNGGRFPGSHVRKEKEGKGRWFTQLKEWVSVSEPSTQALKNYKKETYKKAGIALDDPSARAKLHLPVASLPPEAIKPGGRGPQPEEIALQRAIRRKKLGEGMHVAGSSQGSRLNPSRGSNQSCSSSSTVVDALKDGK
ncbi:hypothetical protein F4777DRAFT_598840 [Nemania sp. FL0916]|nr:hypothetical protein F4777DRAFT_598840 [Nemania sp. FL0916]